MAEGTEASAATYAVVLAGGSGSRMGAAVPKQFLEVAGRPILAHTLEAFEAAPEVDRILLVMAEGYAERAKAVAEASHVTKLAAVIGGGASRSESSRAAVRWIEADPGARDNSKVLLHDAARMLVSGRLIADVVAALDGNYAATPGVPSADTVVTVDRFPGGEYIGSVPDRTVLRRVQTPQGFYLSIISQAYRLAAADPSFTATDDCSVVLRFLPHIPVRVVPGDERNLKVTEPGDLAVAEALLR